MTHPALIERITRSLAYMLRHQPEKFDLDLDAHGFGDLAEVVRALNERLGEPVEVEDVETAIASGDRPRYEIQGERVRALYGHSIDVEPGETARPPEVLFVGIGSRDARRAVQYGLRGGRRRFLHLAKTPEEARETGKRTGREYAVLTVFALDAWEEGVNFYDRQALFLAEQIPTDFLEITDTYEDGFERPPVGDRGRPERGRRGGQRERGGDRGGRQRERSPRAEDDERRPRRERSERSERAPREDRPARVEREAERPERRPEPRQERRPERRPEERRPERRPERTEPPREERAPEPKRETAPASTGSASSFGSGLDDQPAERRERAPARPSAPQPRSEPKPEPKSEPKPEPKPEAQKVEDSGPAFGAGL